MTRLVRGFLDLLSLKLMLSYMTRPMQMFGGLGLLTMVLGFFSGIAALLMKVFMGTDITGNPLLYLTILCVIISTIQFLSLGFLSEMTMRTYHETQNKTIYAVREVIGGEHQKIAL